MANKVRVNHEFISPIPRPVDADPRQAWSDDWNADEIFSGGAPGEVVAWDPTSPTKVSWQTPSAPSNIRDAQIATDAAIALSKLASSVAIPADVTAAIVAAEGYADTRDTATLTSANAHSDAGDTSTLSAANAHSDTGDASTLTSANAHSDTGDASTLTSANAHSDTGNTATLASAKTYSDAGDVTTLASANSHSDAGDVTSLASANAHSDAGISGLFTGASDGALPVRLSPGLSWLPGVAVGSVLVSGGVGAAPMFSASPTLTDLTLGASGILAWSTDVKLTREAPNVLAQYNGVNGQFSRIYNTRIDANNYERLAFNWTGNAAVIAVEFAGTGAFRHLFFNGNTLNFQTSGSTRWSIANAGHLIATAENYDIGTTGANRPRNIFVASSVVFKTKAGTPTDTDVTNPASGMAILDTAASKIWFRVGTTWKGVVLA